MDFFWELEERTLTLLKKDTREFFTFPEFFECGLISPNSSADIFTHQTH